ncbi:phage portal protein, partial [Yersinia enterocolitica]|uniref:phage portal protein n=1 Tax=Yersinia enterocolitica TaxID=630 RepID=UPI0037D10C03
MKNEVRILGPDGHPLAPSRTRAAMLSGGSRGPYDAADSFSDTMANWQPSLWSSDNEINTSRDQVVARVRDMVRNDGWASGSVTRILDNAVGASFRPLAKVDYRTLALMTGNPKFDAKWADEYGRAIESGWRIWANDPNRYCDVERKKTVAQLLRLGFRHKLTDGD